MKFLIFTLSLSLLVSCGKKSTTIHSEQDSKINTLEESGYGLPQVGLHRTVSLNYRLESTYENLTVNPNGNKQVLGEKPFFIFLSENNSINLKMYSKQDIKKVNYLDLGDDFEKTPLKKFDMNILLNPDLAEIKDFNREFTYGEANLDSPQQDMLNKVFIIETEEGDLPFVSNMKIMFWVECHGGFKFTNKENYSCKDSQLKFNYKLLDYSLTKRVD